MELFAYFIIACYILPVSLANRTAVNQRNWEVIPKRVECHLYDTQSIQNFTCKFKRLSRLRGYFTANVYIKPGVALDHIFAKGTAYKKGTNLEYRIYGPKEVVFDICGLLNGTWTIWFADLMFNELKKSKKINVFHPCPFSGHVFVRDLPSTEETYAALNILPDGEYYYETFFYRKIVGKEKPLLKAKTYTEVVGKGLYKF